MRRCMERGMIQNHSIWDLRVFLAAHPHFKRPAWEAHDLDQESCFQGPDAAQGLKRKAPPMGRAS